MQASQNGRADVVEVLIKHTADMNIVTEVYYCTTSTIYIMESKSYHTRLAFIQCQGVVHGNDKIWKFNT